MRVLGYKFIALLFFSLLLDCNKSKNEKVDVFFESVDSVKIVSYPGKMFWVDNSFTMKKEYDFEIPKDKIIDNLTLSTKYSKEIFSILKKDYSNNCVQAACYSPSHTLQFYNDGKIKAYYEFCIGCGGAESSEILDSLPSFCIEKGEEIRQILKKMGLKNYGDKSPILEEVKKY